MRAEEMRGRREGTQELYWKSHFDRGDILNRNVGEEGETLKSNLGVFLSCGENP